MREIKFRAWNTEMNHIVFPSLEFGREIWPCTYKRIIKSETNENGDNVEFVLELVSVDHILQSPEFEVMQYTGVEDFDGNEIYEGDIVLPVKFKDIPNVVEFVNGGFFRVKMHGSKKYYNPLGNANLKVIGNIYEHPHLINKNQ
jgi:uncharacterized phage protein (TIGR01671 family)